MPARTPHRAVIVPDNAAATRDVILSSAQLVSQTPCPFAMSISSWQGSDPQADKEVMLPLIYVSKQAARDRAPDKNEANGAGVRKGWYVIAQPGWFKVFVSYFNRKPYGLPHDNGFSIDIKVDGDRTHERKIFRQGREKVLSFSGFIQKRTGNEDAPREETVLLKPFEFEKVCSALETGGDTTSQVGTIKLKVDIGTLRRGILTPLKKKYEYEGKPVTEKQVAKEGRSMRASRSCDSVSMARRKSRHTLDNRRALKEAEITIFVREKSWLRSKRLIDDANQPVTYEKFCELLNKDNPDDVQSDAVHVKEPKRKRPRIKEQMVLLDEVEPIKPGETIDLT